MSRSASLEFNSQANLTLAARQSLRDSAKGGSLALLILHSGGIGVVKEIKQLEQALDFQALADNPCSGDAHIHVYEWRSAEGIAASFQIATVEVAVAILVHWRHGNRGVTKAALRAEDI